MEVPPNGLWAGGSQGVVFLGSSVTSLLLSTQVSVWVPANLMAGTRYNSDGLASQCSCFLPKNVEKGTSNSLGFFNCLRSVTQYISF